MEHTVGGVLFQLYPRPRKGREATLICYRVGSRRMQATFKGGEEAAKRHCKELAKQVTSGEAIDALHMTALDRRIYTVAKEILAPLGRSVDAAAREYLEACKILAGTGTLLDAARAWKRQHASTLPKISLRALADELLIHLEKKRRETVTCLTLKSIYKPLAKAFPSIPVAEIATADLERYFGSLRLSPRSLNNHRNGIVRLFNYAKGRYLPKDVPTAAEAMEPVSTGDERGAVAIFKPWEFSALLPSLPVKLLPTVLLGGFAGLRTVELCRMDWSAVHFPETGKNAKKSDDYPHGYIEVGKDVAKRHRSAARRIVPIQPNLAQWLEPYQLLQGPVSPYPTPNSLARAISREIEKLNKERAKHKLPRLSRPANGARHSYASYRLPVLKNAAALAIEMNNSVSEIMKNYHELVPPGEVPKWWAILPQAPSEVAHPEFGGAR